MMPFNRSAKCFLIASLSCLVVILFILYKYTEYYKMHGHHIRPEFSVSQQIVAKEYKVENRKVGLDNGEIVFYDFYPEMESFNGIRVISDRCNENSIQDNFKSISGGPNNKFTIITDFMFYSHKNKADLFVGNNHNVNEEITMARDMEIIGVLARNLQHPLVEEVHVIVENDEAAKFLQRLWIPDSHRIVVKVDPSGGALKTHFVYAAECLKNKLVAVSNQDMLFGKGWGKINRDVLRRKKIMYALSRHTSYYSKCSAAQNKASCNPGQNYIGSHDVFFFYVQKTFTPEVMQSFPNITAYNFGMENVLINYFQAKLGYKVLNPCLVLYVHHEHCISIQGRGRIRVNTAETTGLAPFTDKLDD